MKISDLRTVEERQSLLTILPKRMVFRRGALQARGDELHNTDSKVYPRGPVFFSKEGDGRSTYYAEIGPEVYERLSDNSSDVADHLYILMSAPKPLMMSHFHFGEVNGRLVHIIDGVTLIFDSADQNHYDFSYVFSS